MMDIVGNANYDVNSALLMAFYILLDIEKRILCLRKISPNTERRVLLRASIRQ